MSELILPTLHGIQRYGKNHFVFDPVQKTRDSRKFNRLVDAIFYDSFNTIYQLMKPFLDKNVYF